MSTLLQAVSNLKGLCSACTGPPQARPPPPGQTMPNGTGPVHGAPPGVAPSAFGQAPGTDHNMLAQFLHRMCTLLSLDTSVPPGVVQLR